ncbi:AraC family transcriptional regulator [Paenibacillus sp. 32352]|uniref:AraC family transcriptional regulator n=1 Tax=Paenibacillus sp. 32352 TaxID=1969111 RepID=UPI0009AE71F1|nr:AraC family transcriptional regulator [Paenibacillus sp. 32352]
MKTSTAALTEIRSRILSANFFPFKPGQIVGPRLPYVHIFICITAGSGSVRIGDRTWQAEPGDLYYVAPGEAHLFIAEQDDPMVHASVYVDLLSPSTPKQKGDKKLNEHNPSLYDLSLCADRVEFSEGFTLPVHTRLSNRPAWMEPFFTVIESYFDAAVGSDLLLRSCFESFLVRYIQHTLKPQNTFYDPRVARMIEWLGETDATSANVGEWARRLGISTAYLYELFHKQTGTSPQSYLLQCKLDKAKAYLRETNIPVTEIASLLGFSSIHYFARQFSKYAQESATQYRQRFRGFE